MAKRSSKERALRSKMVRREWEPFRLLDPSELRFGSQSVDMLHHAQDMKSKHKDAEWYTNNRYQVVKEPVEYEGQMVDCIWLSIKALDDSARHDWREFQWIKNEIVGKEWEAMEIYPAESRMIDTCNQFHLWCFPTKIGVGWSTRLVMEENTTTFGSQRIWERNKRPDDLITESELVELIVSSETVEEDR